MDMNQGIKNLNWKFSEFLSGINEVLKHTENSGHYRLQTTGY